MTAYRPSCRLRFLVGSTSSMSGDMQALKRSRETLGYIPCSSTPERLQWPCHSGHRTTAFRQRKSVGPLDIEYFGAPSHRLHLSLSTLRTAGYPALRKTRFPLLAELYGVGLVCASGWEGLGEVSTSVSIRRCPRSAQQALLSRDRPFGSLHRLRGSFERFQLLYPYIVSSSPELSFRTTLTSS